MNCPTRPSVTSAPNAPFAARSLQLQRKCACGASTSNGDACKDCKKKLQAKLAVGETDDPLEHEADRIADRVMASSSGGSVGAAPLRVQRAGGNAAGPAYAAPASVERTLAGGGRPLEPAVRHDMEQRFGHDFLDVRVHTDTSAQASARDVSAQAYTSGSHIVFAAHRYAPQSQQGQHLLAHELAHVLQQGGGVVRRAPDANKLDQTAQAIIDAAKDTKTTPDAGERAINAVKAILKAYYPAEAAKVSDVVFKEKESGLSTSPVGKGATLTGKITVGNDFVDNIDKFARRVLQVGHELQHIDQQRGGMGGPAKQNEREFLAHGWAALQDPKPGTGRLSYATRRDMIDCALGHYYCLDADTQKSYEDKKKELVAKREQVNGKRGNPATDAPTSCKPCSPGSPGQGAKSSSKTSALESPGSSLAEDGVAEMPGELQAKLAVGSSDDPLEHEADRIADRVMGWPASDALAAAPVRVQRSGGGAASNKAAPHSVERTLAGGGRPLDPAVRHDMEQRFGHDFFDVRVHDDAQAQASAHDVGALAYTVGRHIVFGPGGMDSQSTAGRRLLAHELAHTVQQSGSTSSVQRYVPCTRARMSLQDCPEREPDEDGKSRRLPMIVEYLTDPEAGFLVANFDIGASKSKPGLTRHVNWPTLVSSVSEAGSEWEIEGMSDCHGPDTLNTGLRQQRADTVRAALPAAAASHIVRTGATPLNNCVTTNDNMVARQWNRGVMVKAVKREMELEGDVITARRPVPGPAEQPTADCNDQQKKEVAHAQPIAVDMVRHALNELRDHDSAKVKRYLRKYFNSDDEKAYARVHDGLLNILKGLKSSVKLECEKRGSILYDRLCPESSTTVTTAYVYSSMVALRVHLCEAAFGSPDLELAQTLVHEFSHLSDWTGDARYCYNDCSTLAPDVAFDNADSYARFAYDLYLDRGNP